MVTDDPVISGSRTLRRLREASSLFARLEEEAPDCLRFVEHGREVSYGSGERIADEGEPAAFFVVLEGEVQAKRLLEGRSVLIYTVAPGAFFGDVPLLLGVPFFASFDTARPTRLF